MLEKNFRLTVFINFCNNNHGLCVHTGGWPLIGIPDSSSTPWSINSTSFFYEKAIGSSALFNLMPFFNAVTQNKSKYALHVNNLVHVATSNIGTHKSLCGAHDAYLFMSSGAVISLQ